MRTSFTIAVLNSGKSEIISKPGQKLEEQRKAVKEMGRTNTKYKSVAVWASDIGIVKEVKFITPEEAERKAKAEADAIAAVTPKQPKAEAEAK